VSVDAGCVDSPLTAAFSRVSMIVMTEYRRWHHSGGTYFFTQVTARRRPVFADPAARALFRQAIVHTQEITPFTINAIALMPDHVHTIWTLPPDDDDFPARWQRIKSLFTHAYLNHGGDETIRSASHYDRRERGVWQRRFWEHVVRNYDEYGALCRYIHYNPVKHGHASCPHAWEFTSFHRFVAEGLVDADWMCACGDKRITGVRPEADGEIVGE